MSIDWSSENSIYSNVAEKTPENTFILLFILLVFHVKTNFTANAALRW